MASRGLRIASFFTLAAALGACSLLTSLDDLQPLASDAGVDGSSSDGGPRDAPGDSITDSADAADTEVPGAAVAIAAGGQLTNGSSGAHACAIAGSDRSLFCWGANDYGQLGNGVTGSGDAGADLTKATKILTDTSTASFTGVDQVSVGSWTTCANKGASLYCWGQRQAGAVGDGTISAVDVTRPAGVYFTTAAFAAGGAHACVAASTGSPLCFGDNHSEQLGHSLGTSGDVSCSPFFDPSADCHASAIAAQYSGGVDALSAGTVHTCVLSVGGVQCWGSTGDRAVGVTGVSGVSTPLPVQTVVSDGGALANVTELSSHGRHNCVLLTDKSVACWGQNDAGQLGRPAGGPSPYAIQVAGLPTIADVGTGEKASCAVSTTGDVYCWGDDTYGQLGDGATAATSTPTHVKGPGGSGTFGAMAKVALGYGFACALAIDKSVWCWGHNDRGQLGDGTTTDRPFPVRVQGLP